MAKKKDKKKKTSGALVPRGGFVPFSRQAALKSITKMAGDYARRELYKGGIDIDKVGKTFSKMRLPTKIEMGKRIAGTVYSVSQDFISGSGAKTKVPFIQADSVGSHAVGSLHVKNHKTRFEHGKSNPLAIRRLAKQNGTTKFTQVDTLRTQQFKEISVDRNHLTFNGGFNRKVILNNFDWDFHIDAIYNAYNMALFKPVADKLQASYACVMNMNRRVKIMHTSRYVKAKYTIKLYKPKEPDFIFRETFQSSLFTGAELALDTQILDKMPIRYQLDGWVTRNSRSNRVWLDPKADLLDAPLFANRYDFVKSFSKTLGPGDTWDFSEILHTGSGLNIDKTVAAYREKAAQEMGHVLVVEAVGQEVQACGLGDTLENFIGTAPVYGQVEFSVGYEFLNNPHTSVSGYTTSGLGGIVDTNYLIRAFTNHRPSINPEKIFNVPVSDIMDDPNATAGKIFIPVMTDTNIAYAQRAREGGVNNDN